MGVSSIYAGVLKDGAPDDEVPGWNMLRPGIIENFYGFTDTGDNVIGIRSIERKGVAAHGEESVPVALPAVRKNYEIGPQGVVEVPRIPYSAHVTRSGTPHRTQHVFGYWHINDKDEIIIPLPPEGGRPARVLIIMGIPESDEADRFAWYCENCLTLLFLRESMDFKNFWQAELAAARDYNEAPENRKCPSCGHQNLLAYSGMQESDTAPERDARMQW